jgi:hypothetical protein
MSEVEPLITLPEAVARLGGKVSPRLLRTDIARGRLAAIKIGRSWYVTASALVTYTACRLVPPSQAGHARSSAASRATPSISSTERAALRSRLAAEWIDSKRRSLRELRKRKLDP